MSKYLVTIGDKKVEYTVKKTVGFEEAIDAYQKIVERLFPDIPDMDGNGNITAYAPYMYDLAEAYAFITLFTDINLDDADNEEIWAAVLLSDIMERICEEPANKSVMEIVRRWVAQFVDDYKNRILAHQKANEFYDAIVNMSSFSEGATIDMEAANKLLSKIGGMSGEDIIRAVTDIKE